LHTAFDGPWHRLALRGDTAAVGRLSSVITPLYRFCLYRVGGNRSLCEEVVQETLLRALRQLDQYEPQRCQGNILPWLTGLARNEVQRVLTRERVGSQFEAVWARIDRDLQAAYAALESHPLPDEVLEREETRQVVNITMSQLPVRYREALEAKYVAGRTVRDLATAWSTTEKAVESQLSRARKAFRETFLSVARNFGLEAP
jgi:RNA polymerase sigma-70 factor (ECF subfamily)